MNVSSGQQKRKHYQNDAYIEEECVDDLTFAAKYASVDASSSNGDSNPSDGPVNGLGVDTNSNCEVSKIGRVDIAQNDVKESNIGICHESSDDESDIDLTEGLEKMNEYSDEEIRGRRQGGGKNPKGKDQAVSTTMEIPKTQNEIDVYNCAVTDLEKQLEINLGLTAEELSDTKKKVEENGSNIAMIQTKKLQSAGTIENHLVAERIIVIKSKAETGAKSNFHYNQNSNGNSVIDEGSLLMVKMDSNSGIREFQEEIPGEYSHVILLGKIIEIFGPISRPLYTLRLTVPRSTYESRSKNDNENDEANSCIDTDTSTQIKSQIDEKNHGHEIEMQSKYKDEHQKDQGRDEVAMTEKTSSIKGDQLISSDTLRTNEEKNELEKLEMKSEAQCTIVEDKKEKNVDIPIEDPWSEYGRYTKWLQSEQNIEVYFSNDQVKVVDTNEVVKNSKRGCDASNVFDEEVNNTNEMYYSDDDQERQAKRGRKKKGKDSSKWNGDTPLRTNTNGNRSQHGRGRGSSFRNNCSNIRNAENGIHNDNNAPYMFQTQYHRQSYNQQPNQYMYPTIHPNVFPILPGQQQMNATVSWNHQVHSQPPYYMGYSGEIGNNGAPTFNPYVQQASSHIPHQQYQHTNTQIYQPITAANIPPPPPPPPPNRQPQPNLSNNNRWVAQQQQVPSNLQVNDNHNQPTRGGEQPGKDTIYYD